MSECPASLSRRSAEWPLPSVTQDWLLPAPSRLDSTTTVTPVLPGQGAADAGLLERTPSPPAATVTRTAAAGRSRAFKDTVSS